MIEPVAATKAASTAIGAFFKTRDILNQWHKHRAERKFEEFCACLETCFERISEEERKKLNSYISRDEAINVLEDFAETIVSSPSHIARMVLALLYCGDNEYPLTEQEKFKFVLALKQCSDETLKFFSALAYIAVKENYLYNRVPYSVCRITSDNFDKLENWEWDVENTHIYVDELIRLKLLAPAPSSASGGMNFYSPPEWELKFGIIGSSINMAGIIRKAIEYLK